jgi:diadenosine tetraphosphate (Ap4A) HIT family hydrolase
VSEFPRAPWNREAYLRLVRAACFLCETVAGNPDYPHHIAYRDEHAIVLLSRMPWLYGHLLVAPVQHREHVVTDFTVDEYLRLQRVVYAAGQALTEVVDTERLYILSLGSQQGNRHVHWHLAPLPPGVPYDEQQLAALNSEHGYLAVPDATMADLATRIRQLLAVHLAPVGDASTITTSRSSNNGVEDAIVADSDPPDVVTPG